jgi:deazaflavin-dependent oxidoreductase (nitroreductase family)
MMRFRKRWLAKFNLLVTNRITGLFAEWLPGFGILIHIGRKSSIVYRTPINVFRVPNGFIVALTYSSQSEWVKNVLAAGSCELKTCGRKYQLSSPGRKVTRTILLWSLIISMLTFLEEPYRTLIWFLALIPKRIEEAIALRPTDLDAQNVLHIRRVLYEGKLIELEEKEQEHIPLDSPIHADLVRKLRELRGDHEWIFRSKNRQPLNVGNVRRRKLHPAAKKAGAVLGGFHDFRHTLSAAMRKADVHLKVRSAVLGHKGKVGVLAHDVYDGVKTEEIRRKLMLGAQWMMQEESMQQALLASSEWFPRMFPAGTVQ